jgi:hypothetical protein
MVARQLLDLLLRLPTLLLPSLCSTDPPPGGGSHLCTRSARAPGSRSRNLGKSGWCPVAPTVRTEEVELTVVEAGERVGDFCHNPNKLNMFKG